MIRQIQRKTDRIQHFSPFMAIKGLGWVWFPSAAWGPAGATPC